MRMASRQRALALSVLLLSCAALATSCARGEPPGSPTPEASLSVATPELPHPATPPSPRTPDATPAAQPPPSAAASASPNPSALQQTRDVPSAAVPQFDARARLLWDAIAEDDPSLAMPFFFPLAAYEKVKDIPNAAADWKHRLVAAYEHDIHALHARLGAAAHAARFVALDVPENRRRWVDPGEEYNKIGYYRVFGSSLRYENGGAARTFEVKSLISWRGEWYVVHLSSIK
jgi:hypothetical protein